MFKKNKRMDRIQLVSASPNTQTNSNVENWMDFANNNEKSKNNNNNNNNNQANEPNKRNATPRMRIVETESTDISQPYKYKQSPNGSINGANTMIGHERRLQQNDVSFFEKVKHDSQKNTGVSMRMHSLTADSNNKSTIYTDTFARENIQSLFKKTKPSQFDMPLKDWNVDNVYNWVKNQPEPFRSIAEKLKSHQIDGQRLAKFDEITLHMFGMKSKDANNVLLAIQDLKDK